MNESPVLIRPAVADDAAAIAVLATHLGYPVTAEEMGDRLARILARDEHETFVAERGGRVVGFVGVMHGLSYIYDPPFVRVLSLVVEPGERGMGTGAALMARAERWALDRGVEQVQLTTALHRDGAHRFYERLGYERTGVRFARKLA